MRLVMDGGLSEPTLGNAAIVGLIGVLIGSILTGAVHLIVDFRQGRREARWRRFQTCQPAYTEVLDASVAAYTYAQVFADFARDRLRGRILWRFRVLAPWELRRLERLDEELIRSANRARRALLQVAMVAPARLVSKAEDLLDVVGEVTALLDVTSLRSRSNQVDFAHIFDRLMTAREAFVDAAREELELDSLEGNDHRGT